MPQGETKYIQGHPAGEPLPPPWTSHETPNRVVIKAGRLPVCYMVSCPQERENMALIKAGHDMQTAIETTIDWLNNCVGSVNDGAIQPTALLRVLNAALIKSRDIK